MSGYERQAEDFCKKYNVKMSFEYLGKKKYFAGDTKYRDVYRVLITRKNENMVVRFGDSLYNTAKRPRVNPTKYDILACLTRYDPESFEFFCDNYGYEQYDDYGHINKASHRIYKAVVKDWQNVDRIFSDCIDELSEIF